MKFQFLMDLIRQAGDKLPEIWPYVVNIKQSLDKIYAIVHGEPAPKTLALSGKKGKGKKGGEHVVINSELVAIAEEHGIPAEALQEVATSLNNFS